MDVQSNLGDYYNQFNKPISVSVISKLTKWSNLQSIGHDAMLSDLKNNFHGLKDAKVQFQAYTSGNALQLATPYAQIQALILLNGEVKKLMTTNPVLGSVGPAVADISNMGAVFSLSPSALTGGVKSVSALVS